MKDFPKFLVSFVMLGSGAVVAIAGILYWSLSQSLPKIISVADYQPRGVTQVLAQEGSKETLIGEYYKERRYLVSYDMIPKIVVQAFLSAEDDKFFEHQGISLVAILRATIANFRAGQVVQGGSTITQQVAKSLFLSPERTFLRKIKEAVLASRIEKNLTKEQILYLYLNQIYLGHGAYGVQAAARAYFNKDVKDLTIGEAALIAGMPRAPSKFSPYANPRKAKEIQRYILRRMVENNVIREEQMVQAVAEPIKIYINEQENTPGKYLLEHLRRYLIQKFGEDALYDQGLKVYVPTRMKTLEVSHRALQKGLREVDKRLGYRGPILKLNTEEEIAKYRDELRDELYRERVPFRILYPDGRMDLNEAASELGIKTDEDLLIVDEAYKAVVLEINDRESFAKVAIGKIELTLPMRYMTWAHPFTEEKGPRPDPKTPSQVLSRGDVVLVRPLLATQDTTDTKKRPSPVRGPKYIASLEQLPQIQGGLFSYEVDTGYVLGLEGGYSYGSSEFNRAIQAKRQPGSAFKPVIYTAGIEKGYTPATILVDSPIVFKDEDFGKWKPSNFEEEFYGETTLRFAFVKSRNIPTIKLVMDEGVKNVIGLARRMGLNADYREDLSISLGSSAASLEEITKLYGVYPRRGRKVYPIYIKKIVNRDGLVLEENVPKPVPPEVGTAVPIEPAPTPSMVPNGAMAAASLLDTKRPFYLPPLPDEKDPDQVLDPRVAYIMTYLMKEVVEYGTGHDAKSLGRTVAGKTGTTNDYKDAWFIGFSPRVVTGVWVGYDDYREMGSGDTGAKAALPIWIDFMREALAGYPEEDFFTPNGIRFASIDTRNGKLIDAKDANARLVPFIEGTQPTEKSAGANGQAVDSESEFIKEDF